MFNAQITSLINGFKCKKILEKTVMGAIFNCLIITEFERERVCHNQLKVYFKYISLSIKFCLKIAYLRKSSIAFCHCNIFMIYRFRY